MQLLDLLRQDGAATAPENFDMPAPVLFEQVLHVFEEFNMTTLVARDRDALYIFLDGCFHDVLNGAVVPQMNDLGAFALQDAPHNIDSGIMTVEQAGRGNNTHPVTILFTGRGLTHIKW